MAASPSESVKMMSSVAKEVKTWLIGGESCTQIVRLISYFLQVPFQSGTLMIKFITLAQCTIPKVQACIYSRVNAH